MGETAVNVDKDKVGQIKKWVDVTIKFLELVSKYLGNAIASILFPRRKKHF